eukprot:TRINITY_DN2782_c0_g1_i1.p1 TRINITY_DN2782_c0_g1~~TRINITY_DN2782_c0_g1_i1.p1  ORF type:complete len:263 (-),score=51.65 TRINITY_DN2782_c0_g1_i1:712-1500(-)
MGLGGSKLTSMAGHWTCAGFSLVVRVEPAAGPIVSQRSKVELTGCSFFDPNQISIDHIEPLGDGGEDLAFSSTFRTDDPVDNVTMYWYLRLKGNQLVGNVHAVGTERDIGLRFDLADSTQKNISASTASITDLEAWKQGVREAHDMHLRRANSFQVMMLMPASGRRGFELHTPSQPPPEWFSRELLMSMLQLENQARLSTQVQDRMDQIGDDTSPSVDALYLELQLEAARSAGAPDHEMAVDLLRSAVSLFPDDHEIQSIPM